MDAVEKIVSTAADLSRHGFGEKPAFEAIIADVDGVFAGMCLFFPSFSTWFGQPGVYVQDIFVEDVFRGLKVGEKLLRTVAQMTAERGGTYLRLSVDAENPSAQAFYERLGLSWSREERLYAARGEAFLELGQGSNSTGETP